MSEQRFEYRLTRILEDKGYLVVNCARSKPFDLIVTREGDLAVYFVESKGKDTPYPEEQFKRQMAMSKQFGLLFAVIRQSKKRGKMRVDVYDRGRPYEQVNGQDAVLWLELREFFE